MGNPILLIRDPELIKCITIKDFDHFVNHRRVLTNGDAENPSLFEASLVAMENVRWKDMRSTLSPVFTGKKMREMFQLMNEVAKESVAFLAKQILLQNEPSVQGYEVNMKEFVTRYTNDVIASTAFGLEVNSFVERDNVFYMMGKRLTNFSTLQTLKFFLYNSMKRVMKVSWRSINS